MESFDVIALIALLVSIISVVITVWATRISARALRLSEKSLTDSAQQEFNRVRADILIQIADSRRQLDKTRVDIGALRAGYTAEPQPVQVLLGRYKESLFDDYLPRLEGLIHQLDELWQDVSTWTLQKPHSELKAVKAVLYRTQKDDELACDSAHHMMTEYQERLIEARTNVAGATR